MRSNQCYNSSSRCFISVGVWDLEEGFKSGVSWLRIFMASLALIVLLSNCSAVDKGGLFKVDKSVQLYLFFNYSVCTLAI